MEGLKLEGLKLEGLKLEGLKVEGLKLEEGKLEGDSRNPSVSSGRLFRVDGLRLKLKPRSLKNLINDGHIGVRGLGAPLSTVSGCTSPPALPGVAVVLASS